MTWISWKNLVADATITATRELAAMPATRLVTPTAAERYRAPGLSAGDTTTRVTFKLPQPRQPQVIFWQRLRRSALEEEAAPPSFSATDTVRHLFSTTDAHGGDVWDSGAAASGVLPGKGVYGRFVPAGRAAAQYLAFEFNATSRATAPENFVDWGYAHYGRVDLEPLVDYAGPASFGWQEGAERRFSHDNAALYVRRKQRRRRWRLDFRAIYWEQERAAVDAFLEYAGDGGRFVVGLDRTDLAGSVMLAMLDQASWSRTSRKFGALSLPLIEAF